MFCRGTSKVEQGSNFLFPLPLFSLLVNSIVSPQRIHGITKQGHLQFINYFKTRMLITHLLKAVSYFCGLFLSAMKGRKTISFSLSLFPVAPTLEHRVSVKRFVSIQILNSKIVGRIPWMRDQPIARHLPIQTQNKQ
jgi:hypothetical protein